MSFDFTQQPLPYKSRKAGLQGKAFGRLAVVALDRLAPPSPKRQHWLCRCECGAEISVERQSLRSGNTTSCGCLQRERAAERRTTHGKSRLREYHIWSAMKARCRNPRNMVYPRYGGRGISVCPQWAASFAAFYADMGPAPTALHEIERVNNDGDYEPGNCRWATPKDQARNKRNNRLISFAGRTQTLAAWSEETGIPRTAITRRLDHGWAVERALTEPARPGRRAKHVV